MVKFILDQSSLSEEPGAETKKPFSSSLPRAFLDRLDALAKRLRREKAVLIRTALADFLNRDPAQQTERLMNYYDSGPLGPPRAFTTTLTPSQIEGLSRLAARLHRPKADLLRAALADFLNLDAGEQDRLVMEYLSS